MEYKTRSRRPKNRAPDRDCFEDRLELILAEFSAPLGEEMPWRQATFEIPESGDLWRDLRPERGRLH